MPDELFSVKDQVALVSGGSRGIGRALAQGLAERGAQVVITGRKQETLVEAAGQIAQDTGSNVRTVVCDVAKTEHIDSLLKTVLDEYGRVDTLLNVAGVNKRQPAETFASEDYDFVLDINLRGAFFLSQAVGRHMIERKRGTQINIDSLNTYAPLKNVLPYAMSKWGLQAMTRGLAAEWGRHGVRVNGLAPGFILTDLTQNLWSDPTMQDWAHRNTPLGRLGEVGDLVGTAVFLASPASAFMTGQTLYVDGGMSAGLHWPIEA